MSITIGTVTIARNPFHPLDWYPVRFNQSSVECADAARAVYDNGPTVIKGTIILKGVLKSEGDALRTYLTGTAIFEKNSFTITPPANTNLGAGDGVALTSAYYDGGPTLEGVFTLTGGGLYDIAFPYRKVA